MKLALPGYAPPREATTAELEKVVSQFARAAGLAKDAGFSGVEVHAAHGYLLSSALSPRINLRDDEWGGTLEKRARLPLKVVRAVRAETGDEFVVGVKLNASDFQKGGLTAADSVATARMLQALSRRTLRRSCCPAGLRRRRRWSGLFRRPTSCRGARC